MNSINLVVVGHVDAGKSTLMGHLLYKLNHVSGKQMHRYETDSQRSGKASFKFAWVLDETEEERARGVTVDLATTTFETENRIINLLDAPGHKDFIPAMIDGATQADCAILVVDATRGEFETGFNNGGQTREHTILVRSLGVKSLIVVVNKMDNVEWSRERFDGIVRQLELFLKQVGFKEEDVKFVPCSGLSGLNLTSLPDVDWYKNLSQHPTLLECINQLEPPTRAVDKATRVSVTDVFKGQSSGAFMSALVESGQVSVKQKLLLLPPNETCIVKFIERNSEKLDQASAGEIITLVVSNVDLNKFYRGCVLCDPLQPCPVTNVFRARIVVFQNVDTILLKGSPIEVFAHGIIEPGIIRKLISLVNRSTGEIIKKEPKCVPRNSSAIVEIATDRPICIETYESHRNLGRITMRYMGKTIAAGMVIRVRSIKPSVSESGGHSRGLADNKRDT